MLFGSNPQPDPLRPEPEAPAPLPAAPDIDPVVDEILRDKTLAYRCHRLMKMGFNHYQARTIAVQRHVDLHDTESLLMAGCPPDIAFDIVS